jgi:Flp pilus assembly protein TadG
MTRSRRRHARSGVAALEFALICPVLLMFAGGIGDFGLALADQSRMASAVAQGAQYGYLNPLTATAAAIKTLVIAGASLPGITVTVTTPSYFCVTTTSTPPALTAATATTTCPDGTSAGHYVAISASYLYPALMPAYSMMVNTTLTEAVTVRIQ